MGDGVFLGSLRGRIEAIASRSHLEATLEPPENLSRVAHRASKTPHRASRIDHCGWRIQDRASQIEHRGSTIRRPGSVAAPRPHLMLASVEGRGSRCEDQSHWERVGPLPPSKVGGGDNQTRLVAPTLGGGRGAGRQTLSLPIMFLPPTLDGGGGAGRRTPNLPIKLFPPTLDGVRGAGGRTLSIPIKFFLTNKILLLFTF